MTLFRRKPQVDPAPRIQTLAEMIAYALTHEITRAGWKRHGTMTLSCKSLGIKLEFRTDSWWSLEYVEGRNGKIPFSERDQGKIIDAAERWRSWDDERLRSEELVGFVEAFEKAAIAADTLSQHLDRTS